MNTKLTRQEKEQEKFEESLSVVFEKCDNIRFEVDSKGIVTILIQQDHPVQRLFRKLHADIPQYRRIRLDAMGSFVFLHVDGRLSAKALGELMEEAFGEQAAPVYPRLFLFLNCMDKQCKYIQKQKN